jgi:hypothetical protein
LITKKDKENILEAFKMVDVKKMDIDHTDQKLVKWFRFGSYNGMMIASEIIKKLPEGRKKKTTKINVD